MTAEAIRSASWMPAQVPLLVAIRFLEDGTANSILKAQLTELRACNALAAALLSGHSFASDPRCMFIWLRLPAPWGLG
ncbi:hypothetical protein [Sinorhizobium sp. CCBAU 05631]|uniref:hypothetical protein n=1 Tax=Sinorhizobium sp. CCBAU 05631 TaxID=794846 RepID=UPI0004BB9523|nr:hypothetical protein [Sinorhizobium sp. CCBAU 05631]ASY59218.1 Transcriptional regulator, GntR family domain [Sinorhizobium sp. CCBAU 05631]